LTCGYEDEALRACAFGENFSRRWGELSHGWGELSHGWGELSRGWGGFSRRVRSISRREKKIGFCLYLNFLGAGEGDVEVQAGGLGGGEADDDEGVDEGGEDFAAVVDAVDGVGGGGDGAVDV
jgi:hypothetical protein